MGPLIFSLLFSIFIVGFAIRLIRRAHRQDRSEMEHILGKKAHKEMTSLARKIEGLYGQGGKRE